MKNIINLWRLICGASRENESIRQTNENLQGTSRYYLQEIDIEAQFSHQSPSDQVDSSTAAWVVTVYSAEEGSREQTKITIPQDKSLPIVVTETLEKRELVTTTTSTAS